VALAPPLMFQRQRMAGMIAQPFALGVATGSYWLTWLKSRQPTPAMRVFADWLGAVSC
jgi:LysR family transcriptional regulator of beta-lactamase